jgi:hypothetical protein
MNALNFLSATTGRLSDQTRFDVQPPAVFLDRASVRGLTSLPPQDGYEGSAVNLAGVLRSGERSQGRAGLAGPVVQVAVGEVKLRAVRGFRQ